MTASCSNSTGNGSVTATPATSETAEPAPVTLTAGPAFAGTSPDDTLSALAVGDFNADGEMDLALGAAFADSESGPDAGKVYVFYGVATYPSGEIAVEEADAVFSGLPGEQAGRALEAADLNGDRVDDLVIGAPAANVEDKEHAGKTYILVGNPVFESVRQSDLSAAPAISGADSGDYLGYTLATGDFNDDGLHDLAIGAFLGDGPANEKGDAGEVYVMYGGDPPKTIDLATTQLDAVIYGAAPGDRLSEGLAAGDFDGDGRDDIIAAATFGDREDKEDVGRTYILTAELTPEIDLGDDVPGTEIIGIDEGDQLGHSLATLDFNGDGFADILLGAVSADGLQNDADLAGEVALILGAAEPPAEIDTARDTHLVHGLEGSRLGRAVVAGDLDGDGFDDAILGASEAADALGNPETGALYVFFGGRNVRLPASVESASIAIYGEMEAENLTTQVNGIPALLAVDLNGDRLADVIVAAARANENRGVVRIFLSDPAP
jgi:hypothetical protein